MPRVNTEPALAASLLAFVLDMDCVRHQHAKGDSNDGGDATGPHDVCAERRG